MYPPLPLPQPQKSLSSFGKFPPGSQPQLPKGMSDTADEVMLCLPLPQPPHVEGTDIPAPGPRIPRQQRGPGDQGRQVSHLYDPHVQARL